MNEVFRSFKSTIESRIAEKSPLIQVLIGPRQVGKTTAIRQIFANQGASPSLSGVWPSVKEFISINR